MDMHRIMTTILKRSDADDPTPTELAADLAAYVRANPDDADEVNRYCYEALFLSDQTDADLELLVYHVFGRLCDDCDDPAAIDTLVNDLNVMVECVADELKLRAEARDVLHADN